MVHLSRISINSWSAKKMYYFTFDYGSAFSNKGHPSYRYCTFR